MSLTMAEWEAEAGKLDPKKAEEIYKAIQTLKGWKPFHDNYKWTCYHVVGQEVANVHKLHNLNQRRLK